MVTSHFERRRPALSTVGRGARGLLGLWDDSAPVIIAGTTIAREENNLHVLLLNRDENAITSLSNVNAPGEVWSLDILDRSNHDPKVFVASRRACDSFVEVWQFNGLSHLNNLSTDGISSSSDQNTVQVVSSSSLAIQGDVLKVCTHPSDSSKALLITHNVALTVDATPSLKQTTSLSISDKIFSNEEKTFSFVTGDWIDDNCVLVASHKSIRIFDTRTGSVANSFDIRKILESSKRSSSGFWVPPHPSRIASACSDGANLVYAGSQNGWIRAFDVRTNSLEWEVLHAPYQRVSAICHATMNCIVSGGMDGVVRCWSREGEPLATFPQHDDTLTNITSCAQLFATVSYDGRVAVNEVPVS